MMSAENDPLGPLPPGWGEFTFLRCNTAHFQLCTVLSRGSSVSIYVQK